MIVDQIRLLIRDGSLKPGDRLPAERELGEKIRRQPGDRPRGVARTGGQRHGHHQSRCPRRRIRHRPHQRPHQRGHHRPAVLSGLTDKEVTEARQIFELGIIPLVCERATEEDIDDLLEICDRGDASLEKGSYPMALSAEFHTRVAKRQP